MFKRIFTLFGICLTSLCLSAMNDRGAESFKFGFDGYTYYAPGSHVGLDVILMEIPNPLETPSLTTYNRRNDFVEAADNRKLKSTLGQEVLRLDEKLVSSGLNDFEILVWSDDCVSFKFNNYQNPDYFAQHIELKLVDNFVAFKLIRMAKRTNCSDEITIQQSEIVPLIMAFLKPSTSIAQVQ